MNGKEYMTDPVKRLNDFLGKELWYIDTGSLGGFRAFFVKLIRLIYVTAREFSEGELTLRAMSLVYTTLLSLVPLLAFSLSILKAFGVHNQLEPLLYNFLSPLGPQGSYIAKKILESVGNMKVGVLGSLGLAVLIYTVISLIQKIEDALNRIWKVAKGRSVVRRLSDYISILIIAPILMFTAIGLNASLMSNTFVQKLISMEPLGTAVYYGGKLIPYIVVSIAHTFIYMIIPNTKVRLGSALLGGVVAGVMWQTTGWAFASFVASSTRYPAIYSSFAVIILFMIWLYLNWLILLIGAEISFCYQNLRFLTLRKEAFHLSSRMREKLSLLIMFLIGYNFYHDKDRWTLDSLVERLGLPQEPIESTLSQLENKGLIIETGDDPPAYLPARDIETIKLKDVLDSARDGEEGNLSVENRLYIVPEVNAVIERLDSAIQNAFGDETIKSLILESKKK
jgi:membrane protein